MSIGLRADDDKDEWKFISVVTLSNEEKRVEINKMIAAYKESDMSQEDINRMVQFLTDDLEDDAEIYTKLSQSDLDANFPQIREATIQESCGSGMTFPQITTHTYAPVIIDNISVNSRKLMCKFKLDEEKGRGSLCQYASALSYYYDKPEDNFTVTGEVAPERAIEVAKAWVGRTFVDSETTPDWLPKSLYDLSYKDGKYVIRSGGCGCWGSAEVSPVTVNNVLHLKVAPEADMWCA